MKKNEIVKGRVYLAKVNSKLTSVRVDAIRETGKHGTGLRSSNTQTVYDVTNLTTGRRTTFRSAQKFREEVLPKKAENARPELDATDVETLEHPEATADRLRAEERQLSHVELESETVVAGHVNGDAYPTQAAVAPQTGTAAAGATNAGQGGSSATPLSKLLKRSIDQLQESEAGQPPHLIVEARAGTGKTTTLIEGLKKLKGLPTSIEPSPQQAAVWEQMALSKDVKTLCMVAFNKSIAEELKRRVPPGCEASTMHSMGFRAVQRAFGRLEVSSWVTQDIISELLETDIRELRRTKSVVLKATEELVSLCKMNLSHRDPCGNDLKPGDPDWVEVLTDLASYYDIDLNGSRAEVFALVPRVLERAKEPKGKISFDDMIWLPVVLDLPMTKFDLLLCDEVQDFNRVQQALAKRAGKRLIMVGDPAQAIYGFAGADSQSMPRMAKELGRCFACDNRAEVPESCFACGGKPKCVILLLTVTRRCGKAIVEEARKIVPDFEAHESNPEGKVYFARY